MSRYRADLRATLLADAVTFSSSLARPFFVVLAALAVAYPIAASYVHAVGASRPRAEALTLAMSPFFDVVYSESLPFMIAVAGIGAFSPSLGILFMSVFIPADLIAASRSTVELQSLQVWGSFPAAILARLISYGLLWILAVEIPSAARGWSTAWAGRGGRAPSLVSAAVARMCATAIFVFFWARALPWLIRPVFTWTPQPFTAEASVPTWVYWPILVIGAAAIAGIAAIWPRPAQLESLASSTAPPAPPARSLGLVLVRQAIAVVVLALLLAGLLPTVREALILVAGLVVAGPVLTLVLPHVPVPSAVTRASGTARWVAAMVIALAVGWVIMQLAGDALYQDYFVLVLTLALVAPLFRLLLEAGTRPSGVGSAPGPPGPPSPAGITTTLLLMLVWLALPTLAWAHDCPGELEECLRKAAWAGGSMLGAALAAIGAALSGMSFRWKGITLSRSGVGIELPESMRPYPERPHPWASPPQEPSPSKPQPGTHKGPPL